MKRKRQQRKSQNSNQLKTINRSPKIITKNFEIFVTDFLTDPCGLPVELKECVLVDGTISIHDNSSDNSSSTSSQILKKIFANSFDEKDSSKKTE